MSNLIKSAQAQYRAAFKAMTFDPVGWKLYKSHPVVDSNNAMTLIAHLQLCVQGHDTGVTVSNPKGTILINVEYNSGSDSDKTAALLLAITRTAAAIGNTL